jgi:hypothetical protein
VHVRVVVDDDDRGRAVRADLCVRDRGRGGGEGRGGGDEASEGEGGSDGGETHGTGERGSGVEDWRVWELEMSVQNGRCNPSLYTQSMQRGH